MNVNRRGFIKGALGAMGGFIASGGTLAIAMASDHHEQNMIEIYARNDPFIILWFNGKDMSSQATGCRVSACPGKVVWGWVDFLVLDEDGDCISGPDYCPLTHRRHGLVKWKRENARV